MSAGDEEVTESKEITEEQNPIAEEVAAPPTMERVLSYGGAPIIVSEDSPSNATKDDVAGSKIGFEEMIACLEDPTKLQEFITKLKEAGKNSNPALQVQKAMNELKVQNETATLPTAGENVTIEKESSGEADDIWSMNAKPVEVSNDQCIPLAQAARCLINIYVPPTEAIMNKKGMYNRPALFRRERIAVLQKKMEEWGCTELGVDIWQCNQTCLCFKDKSEKDKYDFEGPTDSILDYLYKAGVELDGYTPKVEEDEEN